MVNFSNFLEEKEIDKNNKNFKDFYLGYLTNYPQYIRSNMNLSCNPMMMDESINFHAQREWMMNSSLKENSMFVQRRHGFHDKKNKGIFSNIFSFQYIFFLSTSHT